jgi:hypothetical protein
MASSSVDDDIEPLVSCAAEALNSEDPGVSGAEGAPAELLPWASVMKASDARRARASWAPSSSSSSSSLAMGRTTQLSLRILRSAAVARGNSSSDRFRATRATVF